MSDQTTQAAPPTWRDTLPDDLKADPTLATVPDVPTLAKNYLATKAMTGKKAYELPQPDWTPEKRKEWHKTIGVPETPDKYPSVDKTILEKAGVPAEVLSTATTKFHELGLTPDQAKGLLDWYVGDAAKGAELQQVEREKARATGEAALKQEWGDSFDAKMGLVKVWLKENGSEDLLKWAEETGAGNNPAFIKALVNSASKTLESNSRLGINPGGAVGPAAAQAALSAFKADKEKMDRMINGDKALIKEYNELNQASWAGKKTA